MRKVTGTYVKEGEIVPFDADIPSEWAELAPHQAATILEVLTYGKADKYVIAASLLSLLFDKNWHILAELDDEALHSLMPLTNFMLESRPPAINYFPKLNIRKKVCHAPADDLSNICFGEWCFAYQAYHYYVLTKENQFLDKLVAVLYRPADAAMKPDSPNFTGDIREPFNENLIMARERAVGDIEYKFKQAVLSWFASALYNVMADREHVFPKKKDDEQHRPDDTGDDHRTWFTVFREILGPKWGTADKLKFTNALFVLDALEEDQIVLKKTK